MSPLVSIIFPIYNSEKYLKDSLNSLLIQTHINIEIIALDDGSTDLSYEILKSFKDSRLKIYRTEENRGIIYQLNRGILYSRGEYIARMDSDDIAMPDRIEKQLKYLKNHPEISLCGTFLTAFSESFNQDWSVPTEHNDIVASMLFDNSIYHPTVLGIKDVFCHFYDEQFKHAEDYELWTRLAAKGFKFGNLSEALIQYRLHENQIGSLYRDVQKFTADQIRQRQLNFLGLESGEGLDFIHILKAGSKLDDRTIKNMFEWISLLFKINRKNKIFCEKSLANEFYKRLNKCLYKSEENIFEILPSFYRFRLYRYFSFNKFIKLNYFYLKKLFCTFLFRREQQG